MDYFILEWIYGPSFYFIEQALHIKMLYWGYDLLKIKKPFISSQKHP